MRFQPILFSLLVSAPFFAAAQMPACAMECLGLGLRGSACGPTDFPCICHDAPLIANLTTCVGMTCTIRDALTTRNATATMCSEPVRDITNITPIVTGVSGSAAILAFTIRVSQWQNYFGADDVFTGLALAVAIPMGALEFVMSNDGFGKDIWTIAFSKIDRIVKFTWLTEVLYMACMAWTKMAFLCLYLRIFPSKQLRKVIYGMLAICTAYWIAFVFATIFNCSPLPYIWTSWDGEHTGKCFNFHNFAWAHAGINIALDLIVIGMPFPELLKLSLNGKNKFYILVMFSFGLFTTIVSIIRLRSLVQFASSQNPTYDNVPTAYWSVMEANVGIVCACMPAIRRLLGSVFPGCFGSTNASYDDTPNYKISSGRKTPARSKNFDWTITKTDETRIESNSVREDDEIKLVEINAIGKGWDKAGSTMNDSRRSVHDSL